MQLRRARPSTGAGPWPAVIFCMDAGGLREALDGMAQRIADENDVVVVLPDLFFVAGDIFELAPPGSPRTLASFRAILADPDKRAIWGSRFFGPTTASVHMQRVGEAVLAALDGDPEIVKELVGVAGYCMGGHCALKLAGLFPERVARCASFHGGHLATDASESPHRLAPRIRARVYVAGARDDGSFDAAAKARLEQALADAGRDFVVETYDALHGFAVPDAPSFDTAAAERHYAALRALLAGL